MSVANPKVRMTKAQKKNAREMTGDAAEAMEASSSGAEEPSAGRQRVGDAPGAPTPVASPAAMPSAPSAPSGASDPTNAELKDLMLSLIATQRSDKANIDNYMAQQAEILSTIRDKYEAESARTEQRSKAIEDQLARMSID